MSLVNNITYGRFKFFWSIKNVTFDLLVESGCFDSFAFSFSTSFNTFNLSLYTSKISKYFQCLSPFLYLNASSLGFFASSLETLAKDEKYLALLLSSPLRNAYIFISLGSSVKENFTFSCLPIWEHVIILSSIFRIPAKNTAEKRLRMRQPYL
jgi:hypothetical protein